MDFNEVLRSIESKEIKLNDLKSRPKENAAEIYQLILDIRGFYKTGILLYTDGAGILPQTESGSSKSIAKDLDGALWRTCFYKQIEEYRSSIKKTTVAIEGDSADMQLKIKYRSHLSKLTTALARFLSESSQFYLELLGELEQNYKKRSSSRTTNSIFKCLLYLGDLSRYYTAHGGAESANGGEQKSPDFSTAHNYYERAACVLPSSGNPHNQLAMLATYNKHEFVAVYYYCRSILCALPFASGMINLASIFEGNKKLFTTLHGSDLVPSKAVSLRNLSSTASKAEVDKTVSLKLKSFYVGFIRLQGFIFEINRNIMSASQISDAKVLDVALCDPLRDHLLAELEELLPFIATQSAESLLSQLLAILLFTVHFSSNSYRAFIEKFPNSGLDSNTRSVTELSSLITLYGFLKKITVMTVRIANAASTSSKDRADRSKKTVVSRYMAVLSLFSEWYLNSNHKTHSKGGSKESPNTNPNTKSKSPSSSQSSPYIGSICGDEGLENAEGKAFVSVRSSLSLLLDIPNILPGAPSTVKARSSPFMREHLALRGFSPLMPLIDEYFSGYDAITSNIVWPSEDECNSRRLKTIQDFVTLTDSSINLPKAADEGDVKHTRIALPPNDKTKKSLSQQSTSKSKSKSTPGEGSSTPVFIATNKHVFHDSTAQNGLSDVSEPNGLDGLNSNYSIHNTALQNKNMSAADGMQSSPESWLMGGLGIERGGVPEPVEDYWSDLANFRGIGQGAGLLDGIGDGNNNTNNNHSNINSNLFSFPPYASSISMASNLMPHDDDDVDEEVLDYRPTTSRFVFASETFDRAVPLQHTRSQDDLSSSQTNSGGYNMLNPFGGGGIHPNHDLLPPYFLDPYNGSGNGNNLQHERFYSGVDSGPAPYAFGPSSSSMSFGPSLASSIPLSLGYSLPPPPGLKSNGNQGFHPLSNNININNPSSGGIYPPEGFRTDNPFLNEY